MNLIDAYVTEVVEGPYFMYGMWWVEVKYNSEGRISRGNIMCETFHEADAIDVGHKFQT